LEDYCFNFDKGKLETTRKQNQIPLLLLNIDLKIGVSANQQNIYDICFGKAEFKSGKICIFK